MKLSKKAQNQLAENGKLTVRLKLVFTPDGGSPAAKKFTVKFAK